MNGIDLSKVKWDDEVDDGGIDLSQVNWDDQPSGSQMPLPVSEGQQEERPNLITHPFRTIAKSGGEFLGGIGQVVAHPIQTAKGIGSMALGGVQKFIPGEQAQEQSFDALLDFYKNRYGSIEAAKQTVLEDPVGFASDASVLFTGGGAAATKLGQLGKAGRLGKFGKFAAQAGATGKTLSRVGQFIDPTTQALRGIGAGAKAVTKNMRIGLPAGKLNVEAIKAAERTGVTLPASAKTTGMVTPLVEAAVSKGLFGQKVVDRIDDAYAKMAQVADDVVKETGRAEDMTSAGNAIVKGFDDYHDNFIKVKNELYKKAEIPTRGSIKGEVITVAPKKSIEFIDDILKEKRAAEKVLGKSQDLNYFENLKESLTSRKVLPDELRGWEKEVILHPNAESFVANNINKGNEIFLRDIYKKVKSAQPKAFEVRAALKELNNKLQSGTDPIATGNKATLKRLAASLSDDLDESIITQRPELSEEINTANKFYREGIEKINSDWGVKIAKNADKPDKILPAIINKGMSSEDVGRIYEVIGEKNIPDVQAAFINDMFRKASKDGRLTPQGLAGQIKAYGDDKLRKILSPNQYKVVKDLETLSKSMGRGKAIAEGSQTAFIGKNVFYISHLLNPGVLIPAITADYALSKLFSSTFGQKLLAEGFSAAKAGEKIAEGVTKATPTLMQFGRMGRVTQPLREKQEFGKFTPK